MDTGEYLFGYLRSDLLVLSADWAERKKWCYVHKSRRLEDLVTQQAPKPARARPQTMAAWERGAEEIQGEDCVRTMPDRISRQFNLLTKSFLPAEGTPGWALAV